MQQGKFTEHEIWNPYAIGANHQGGSMLIYEPLAFYSAFADKEYPWLAESYQYSPDFKTLTIKTAVWHQLERRQAVQRRGRGLHVQHACGISARRSSGASTSQQFLQEAKATDANTAVLSFKVPAPRFWDFIVYKYDIGVYIVPKHIYDGQDWTSFRAFDPSKGLPGHHRAVGGQGRRRPSRRSWTGATDWWAVKAGLTKHAEGASGC